MPQNNFLFNELALHFDTDYTLFQSKGLGIINAAGVAMGLLTNAGPPEWHPAPDSLRQVCAAAGQYCKVRTFFFQEDRQKLNLIIFFSDKSLNNAAP